MGVSLFAPRSLPLTTVISTRISMPPQRQPQPNRPRWKQDKRKGARAHDPPPSSSRLPPNPKRSYSTASNASIDASTSTTLPRGTTLMTYNVEGLRKITNETNGPRFWSLLSRVRPDFLMMQETQLPPKTLLDPRFLELGYKYCYIDRPAINGRWGVATLCKEEPINILLGEDDGMPEDLRGRLVVLEFEEFILLNVYAPYAGDIVQQVKNLDLKLRYLSNLELVIRKCDKRKPLIWAGDFNVRMDSLTTPLPVVPPSLRTGNFTSEELSAYHSILNPRTPGYRPMRDAFSHFHPIPPNQPANSQNQLWKRFTRRDGWDGKKVLMGQGSRLDGFIVSNRFVSRLESCEIERTTFCSDHFPVVLTLKPTKPHQIQSNSTRS
ncbi:Endonuclease/exonuclease/phosphatase [Mrakia frigida]|uniref:Endonuclease/exonuclease/phosphatase n=1 Tax=Mrakia frigida TaxID=29902 RepID=UPI003FCC08A3